MTHDFHINWWIYPRKMVISWDCPMVFSWDLQLVFSLNIRIMGIYGDNWDN